MPRRKAALVRRVPKRPRAKKEIRLNRQNINRGITYFKLPFPPSFRCALSFTNHLWFAQTTAGAANGKGYRLNSLYDPNYSETGGINNQQPYFFDQMTALYSNYIVESVTITGQLTVTGDAYIIYRPSLTTTMPTNAILESERPASGKFIQAQDGKSTTFTKKYNIHQIFGITKQKYNIEENYSAANASTPTNIAYWWIVAQAVDPAATFTLGGRLQFTFHGRFFNPIVQLES